MFTTHNAQFFGTGIYHFKGTIMKFILTFSLLVLGLASFGGKQFFDVAGSKPEHYRLLGKRTSSYKISGDKLIITIPPSDLAHSSDRWPGLILKPTNGRYFDFSGGSVVAVDVRNLTRKPLLLQCEMVILGKKREFAYNAVGGIGLEPEEKATLRVRYLRGGKSDIDWTPGGLLVNFDGFGALKHHLIPDKVEQIRFFVLEPEVEHRFELSNFRLEDPPSPLPAALSSKESFFPCIDRFGQYKHTEWPGKIHDEDELKKYAVAEAADLAAHPGPADRTPYGGWASGPDYPATGNFYPVRHDGKWFLVDPSGKLFWSLGMDTVMLDNQEAVTGLALREHYFEALPPRAEARWCYSTYRPRRRWYKEQGIKETECVSFLLNNLRLKDGGSKKEVYAAFYDRVLKRLKSWGFNTLGNWTDRSVVAQKKLPYADSLYINGEVIPGDRGTWRKFHEVFSPNFEKTLIAHIKKYRASSLNDPYCIGFFVDNELSWGDDAGLVRGVLRSPAGQPSKIAFSERLKAKYGSVEKLNQAWGSSYRSWQDFLESTELPDEKRAWDDLVLFNTEIINLYFSKIREVFNTVLPGKLYLGCRFPNDYNRSVVKIAAKYVDVLSFNLYKYSIGTFQLPEGVDKPIIIGEWHFGTMQYGPPNPGLCNTADQTERARAFDRYVRSALWNRNVVGVHYYGLYDQVATGRPNDCENMQIGFLSIVDNPYPEMVSAARKISGELYQLRSCTQKDKELQK